MREIAMARILGTVATLIEAAPKATVAAIHDISAIFADEASAVGARRAMDRNDSMNSSREVFERDRMNHQYRMAVLAAELEVAEIKARPINVKVSADYNG